MIERAAPGTQMWVVLPWRWRETQRVINLRRLARIAEAMAVDLRLVSRHSVTRALAREAGLRVHLFLPPRLWGHPALRSPRSPRAQQMEADLGWWYRRRGKSLNLMGFFLSLLGVALLVGVMGLSLVIFLPKATLVLEPVAHPVEGSLRVHANILYRDIDYGKAIIPARMVQVIIEGYGDTPTTGSKEVPDGRATGEVVFANRTNEAVTIPKGTIVRTTSGVTVRFYTVADVELPPRLYSFARVPIIAMEPGLEGNVKAFTINMVEGEFASKVEVLNDAPTRGGSTKRMALVDQEDFDRLRDELIAKLQRQAYEQLIQELAEGEFVPPESLDVQVMSQEYHQVLDQESEILSMDMKIVARGIAVDGQALRKLAARFLEEKAGGDLAIIQDSLVVTPSEEVQVAGREVVFDVAAQGLVAQVIDTDRIGKAIRGQEVPAALAWIQEHIELRRAPDLTLSPEWWGRIPLLPRRVEIVVSSGVS